MYLLMSPTRLAKYCITTCIIRNPYDARYDLGNVYLHTGENIRNNTLFGRLCSNGLYKIPDTVERTKVENAKVLLKEYLSAIPSTKLKCKDAQLVLSELQVATGKSSRYECMWSIDHYEIKKCPT